MGACTASPGAAADGPVTVESAVETSECHGSMIQELSKQQIQNCYEIRKNRSPVGGATPRPGHGALASSGAR